MQAFIGTIMMFGGNFAPRGWLMCNGQLLAIAQNTALFSILGTTYGGNGIQTFALPNFQGRGPVHAGNSGAGQYVLGEVTGNETATLLLSQMPQHTHATTVTIGANASPQTATAEPADAVPAGGSGLTVYATGAPDGTTKMNAGMASVVAGNAGGSQPHSILQPLIALNFIICIQGLFPSRN